MTIDYCHVTSPCVLTAPHALWPSLQKHLLSWKYITYCTLIRWTSHKLNLTEILFLRYATGQTDALITSYYIQSIFKIQQRHRMYTVHVFIHYTEWTRDDLVSENSQLKKQQQQLHFTVLIPTESLWAVIKIVKWISYSLQLVWLPLINVFSLLKNQWVRIRLLFGHNKVAN